MSTQREVTTEICELLNKQLANTDINVLTNEEYDDMLYVYPKHTNAADFKLDANYARQAKELNKYLALVMQRHDNLLFSMDISSDGTRITFNVPYVTYYSWGEPTNGYSDDICNIKTENAAYILKEIYDYCVNNPIVYCIDTVCLYNLTLHKSDLIKVLLKQAESAYAELCLLAKAANI